MPTKRREVYSNGLIVVMVARVYTVVKMHQTVHLKGYIVLYIKLILKDEGSGLSSTTN